LDAAPRAEAPQPAPARRGRFWQTAVGVGISAAFLYWSLRGVSPAAFLLEIRSANIWLFLTSATLATFTFPARAARWRIILGARTSAVRWTPVWHATAIGFMANNVLPARAGEIARAYAASRLVGLPFAASIGSVAVERVFDGLVVMLLLAFAMTTSHFATPLVVHGRSVSVLASIVGGVFILALMFLFVLVHTPQGGLTAMAVVVRRLLPSRIAGALLRITKSFVDGLSVLRAPRDFFLVIVWSFVVWFINAAAIYSGFLAFHVPALPITSALLLQGIVAVGVAIPASPGFFGPFEYFSIVALGLYGVGPTTAAGFALGTHIGWYIPITAIGLWYLARSGLSLHDITAGEAAA